MATVGRNMQFIHIRIYTFFLISCVVLTILLPPIKLCTCSLAQQVFFRRLLFCGIFLQWATLTRRCKNLLLVTQEQCKRHSNLSIPSYLLHSAIFILSTSFHTHLFCFQGLTFNAPHHSSMFQPLISLPVLYKSSSHIRYSCTLRRPRKLQVFCHNPKMSHCRSTLSKITLIIIDKLCMQNLNFSKKMQKYYCVYFQPIAQLSFKIYFIAPPTCFG